MLQKRVACLPRLVLYDESVTCSNTHGTTYTYSAVRLPHICGIAEGAVL